MQLFKQFEWDEALERDCRTHVSLALAEDLNLLFDWTTVALVPADRTGSARIVSREAGTAAGFVAIPIVIDEARAGLKATMHVTDGQRFEVGATLAELHGNVGDLLTLERTLLNFVGRLTGIATLAARFVEEVAGTKARVYDTRKTIPGWRRLEKYAVRCGGATNHRMGLFDAVLIKDNHLAQRSGAAIGTPADAAAAVREVRQFLASPQGAALPEMIPIEVEVDSLEQLEAVLDAGPDVVLLDNMSPEVLRQAVEARDRVAPHIELEASGGVRLGTIRQIAETGVERISAGAITHSARSLDISLEWQAV